MYSIITSVVWLSLYNYFNAYLKYGNLLYITEALQCNSVSYLVGGFFVPVLILINYFYLNTFLVICCIEYKFYS